MKKIAIILIICLSSYGLYGQILKQTTLEGTVYDTKTKETIPGVAIYLDGTSIITTTDNDGYFKLVVEQKINANLIFSHLSYDILVVEKPFEQTQKAFFLKEKVNTLNEVVVTADRIPRQEKMATFKEHFLGKSVAAKSCIIVNEEDISLRYDLATDRLIASAKSPIIIENRHLAYRITYDLSNFTVQFVEKLPDYLSPVQVTCLGSFSFEDLSPHDLRVTTRRNELYVRSPSYFWKNLVSNTLNESKYKIYNRNKQVEPNPYFIIEDTLSQKVVYINTATDINRQYEGVKGPIFGVIRANQNNKFDSNIVFLTPSFSVDEFGNINAVDKVIYFGEMGDQRLGDLLPADFKYNPTSSSRR